MFLAFFLFIFPYVHASLTNQQLDACGLPNEPVTNYSVSSLTEEGWRVCLNQSWNSYFYDSYLTSSCKINSNSLVFMGVYDAFTPYITLGAFDSAERVFGMTRSVSSTHFKGHGNVTWFYYVNGGGFGFTNSMLPNAKISSCCPSLPSSTSKSICLNDRGYGGKIITKQSDNKPQCTYLNSHYRRVIFVKDCQVLDRSSRANFSMIKGTPIHSSATTWNYTIAVDGECRNPRLSIDFMELDNDAPEEQIHITLNHHPIATCKATNPCTHEWQKCLSNLPVTVGPRTPLFIQASIGNDVNLCSTTIRGTTYYSVTNVSLTCSGTNGPTLSPTSSPTFPMLTCSSKIPVRVPTNGYVDLVWKVPETLSPDQVTVSTCGSKLDTRLNFLSGNRSLFTTGSSMGICGRRVGYTFSNLMWSSSSIRLGGVYIVRVSGQWGYGGDVVVSVTCGAPLTASPTTSRPTTSPVIPSTISMGRLSCGLTTSYHSLSSGVIVHEYSFVSGVNRHRTVVFDTCGSYINTMLTLKDSNGRVIASNRRTGWCSSNSCTGCSRINATLGSSTYTLRVMAITSGSYLLHVRCPLPTTTVSPMDVTSVSCGSVLTGSLVSSYQAKNFSFYTGSRSSLTATTCGSSFDTELTIQDGNTRVTSNDDNSNVCTQCSTCSAITKSIGYGYSDLTPFKTYTIVLSGYGSNYGNYQFSLSCPPIATTVSPSSVSCGQTLNGYLNPSQTKHFSFYSVSSHYLEVRTCGSSFDTKLELLDAHGTIVASNDDVGSGVCGSCTQCSRIVLTGTTLRANMMYTIRLMGYASASGSYRLNIACNPSNVVDMGNLYCGTVRTGTMVSSSTLLFTLNSQYSRVEFSTCGSGFDTVLNLTDLRATTVVSSNDDSTTCGHQAVLVMASGTMTSYANYRLRLHSYRHTTAGAYTLRMICGGGTLTSTSPSHIIHKTFNTQIGLAVVIALSAFALTILCVAYHIRKWRLRPQARQGEEGRVRGEGERPRAHGYAELNGENAGGEAGEGEGELGDVVDVPVVPVMEHIMHIQLSGGSPAQPVDVPANNGVPVAAYAFVHQPEPSEEHHNGELNAALIPGGESGVDN